MLFVGRRRLLKPLNMQALKFKAQPTNLFCKSNVWQLLAALPSCRMHSNQMNITLTVAKTPLNFRDVHMLLKGAVILVITGTVLETPRKSSM